MKNRNHLFYPTSNTSTLRPTLFACMFVVAAFLGAVSQALAAAAGSLVPPTLKTKQAEVAARQLLKLPLLFEDTGDLHAMAVHLGDRQLVLGNAGSVELRSSTGPALSIELEGANLQSLPVGQDRLPGKSNYFLGNDPSRWRKGVEQFSHARVKDVYNGVDLLYYGNGTQLEHDYILAPGSDPSVIRMRISGGKTAIDSKTGDLIVSRADTGDELIHLVRPVAYQQAADGSRKPIKAQYTRNENGSFGFTLGTYDHALPLTIDPVVTYSTYFGGSNNDEVNDIKTDAAGNLVLLVATSSTDLPVVSQIPNSCAGTCGPTNPSPQSSPRIYDFYLAKLDPTGQTLLYSTYIGGSADDTPGALFIASDGTLYISGQTQSTDFPTVNGYPSAIPDYRYYHSSTLTKLSADGSTILYSSLIGAGLVNSFENSGYSSSPGSLAVGSNGIAYLVGYACCGQFLDAKNTGFTAGGGSFIAKFDTTKCGNDSLLYATTFGQPGDSGGENLQAIALDSKQNLWAVGYAYASYASKPIPTPDAVQPICDGGGQCGNAFLHGLTPAGAIFYTSFLGGTKNSGGGPGFETPIDIVIDASDNIYLSGTTESVDFPLKNAPFTTLDSTDYPDFLTKLSPGGKSILYSTYIPSVPFLATSPGGEIAVVGNGTVPQVNAIPPNAAQLYADVAFEVFDTTKYGMDSLLISSYLGSLAHENPQAASVDAQGNLLIAGITGVNPVLVKPYQSTCTNCGFPYGIAKGFVTRVQLGSGSLTLTPSTQSFPDTSVGTSGTTQTSTLTNTTEAAITLSSGTLSDSTDFGVTDDCHSTVASGASCTFTFSFKPQSATALSATYSIYDVNKPSSPLSVTLTGTGTAPPVAKALLTPAAVDFGTITVGHTGTAQIFTLSNSGGAALAITSVGLSGSNAGDYSIAANTCGTSLAAGGSCAVTLNFKPSASDTRAATLSVVDKVGTQTASLTGKGIFHPIAISPASFDFGLLIASNYQDQDFTLTNISSAPANIDLPSITEDGVPFKFDSSTICGTIAPGGACILKVRFQPFAAGSFSAILNITDFGGAQTVSITGRSVLPTVTLMPTTFNFGTTTVGAYGLQTFTLTNTSAADVDVSLPTINQAGSFSFATPPTCPPFLDKGESCTVTVKFDPTTAGSFSNSLTFTDTGGTQTATLTGRSVLPTVTFSPSSYDYGSIQVHNFLDEPFTITNTSNADVTISSATVSQVGNTDFSIVPSTGCTTIAPAASCIFELRFYPNVIGSETVTFTLVDTAGTQTAVLTGTGIPDAPQLVLSPSSYSFGAVPAGTTQTKVVTLTNVGSAEASFSFYVPLGHGDLPMEPTTDTCTGTLAPDASCSVTIQITGAASGSSQIPIYATGNPGTNSVEATLVGFGADTNPTPAFIGLGNGFTTDSLTLNGIAAVNAGSLQLTQNQTSQASSAFYPTAMSTARFSTNFAFQLLDPLADGITFTIQGEKPNAIGNSGSGLGYQGIAKSIALKFGLRDATGASDNSTGIYVNGAAPTTPSISLAGSGIDLHSGHIFQLGLQYDGTTEAITLTDTSTNAVWTTTVDEDIPSIIGANTAYFGFTAATGAAAANAAVAKPEAATATTSLGTTANILNWNYVNQSVSVTDSITLSPASYDFGDVAIGNTATKVFTFTNTSNAPLTLTQFVGGGDFNYGFASPASEGECFFQTLAPLASCTVAITFSPSVARKYNGTFGIVDAAGTQAFSFTGTGMAPPASTPFISFGTAFTTDALTLSGAAAVENGALQLTAGPSSAASSAFYPSAEPTSAFTSDFTFQLLDPTAEGITFTIQGDNPNAVGLGGGGLGYQGLAKSLAVKFDLKDTAGEGVDSTGIYVDGAAPTIPATSLASSGIDLHSGHVFDLRLTYDGTTMSINLADNVTGAVWTTQVAEDIPAIVGGSTAYFGFTAGSGTPALTSDATESARAEAVPALTSSAAAQPPATSQILTWIYVGTAETKTAQTLTFPSLGAKTYGAAPVTIAATASSGLPVSYSVQGPAKLFGSNLTITGAGEVSVTATQPGNASFASAAPVTRSFTVAKAVLSVTATSLSRLVGVANPALTYEVSGFVDGDSTSAVSGTAVLSTAAVSGSPAGKYPITFSTEGLTAANYTFKYVPGTLTVSPGTLVIAPASGNFGNIKVGATSPVISFTVTNDTASTMGYLGYTNLGEFYLQPGTCHLVNGEPMLNPGKSCVFTAVFKPTKGGPVCGNLSIQTSSGTFNVPMSGTGSTLVISPSSGSFGSIEVGSTSPVKSFTVSNDTTSTMGYLGYTNLGEFYLQPGTCHLVNGETMLNPGKSCVFTAVFKPTKAGAVSGNLSIQTSSGTFNVPMSGTGATP